MKVLRILLCLPLFFTSGALAVDDAGKFALKGAGFLPCGIYVSEREKRSNIYYMIGGWLEGYLSAYNKYNEDTYDVTSFETLELLLLVMDNHCKANPQDRLYSVINSLIIQIGPKRLQRESPKVEIKNGDRQTVLYRETIRRIQSELTQLGLFKGELDGRYTDATKAALIAFQSDLDFETTGFPDQTTLWRLLRK